MKNYLELKVPPVVVLLILAILMWFCEKTISFLSLTVNYNFFIAIFLAVLGCGVVMAGVYAFHRAGTTVNPMKPETTAVLVKEGVYRFSRNPIYSGLIMILLGWGIYLSNLLALLCVFGFVVYMNHFQIQPEERMLHILFSDQFKHYRQKVRRWF